MFCYIFRILDSLLDISKDLASMPIALGPAPVLYQSTSEMINLGSSSTSSTARRDDGSSTTIRACDPEKYFEACLENGHCDTLESETASSTALIHDADHAGDDDQNEVRAGVAAWDDFNRDIELM